MIWFPWTDPCRGLSLLNWRIQARANVRAGGDGAAGNGGSLHWDMGGL